MRIISLFTFFFHKISVIVEITYNCVIQGGEFFQQYLYKASLDHQLRQLCNYNTAANGIRAHLYKIIF